MYSPNQYLQRDNMPQSKTPDPCSKQPLFLEHLSPTQSAWIAFGTMLPMVAVQCLIILVVVASGEKNFAQQRRRLVAATTLLLIEAALAFVLNLAFMHMQYCGPASSTPAVIGTLSIWAGDIATVLVLVTWICGVVGLVKAWKKERQRRESLTVRGRIDIQELQELPAGAMANKVSSSARRPRQ